MNARRAARRPRRPHDYDLASRATASRPPPRALALAVTCSPRILIRLGPACPSARPPAALRRHSTCADAAPAAARAMRPGATRVDVRSNSPCRAPAGCPPHGLQRGALRRPALAGPSGLVGDVAGRTSPFAAGSRAVRGRTKRERTTRRGAVHQVAPRSGAPGYEDVAVHPGPFVPR